MLPGRSWSWPLLVMPPAGCRSAADEARPAECCFRLGFVSRSSPRPVATTCPASRRRSYRDQRGARGERSPVQLDPGASSALARIQDMNTPSAVHFRYFWLEILATPAAMEHVGEVEGAAGRTLLTQGRSLYLDLLERQEVQNLQRADGDLSPTEAAARGNASASPARGSARSLVRHRGGGVRRLVRPRTDLGGAPWGGRRR
jgi:hypothetical protein